MKENKQMVASEIPGRNLPEGFIILNLVLDKVTEYSLEDDEDKDLSPSQRSVLREIRGEDRKDKKIEQITSPARFAVENIEGYYGSIKYTILLFNGDAFNVTDTPNEVDLKIKKCYEGFTQR